MNGYQTAYYKYHYPAEFMAAVLKSEFSKTSSDDKKVEIYKNEAKRLGINILTPDINDSEDYFSALNDDTIVMGLAAVKGVGEKAVNNIIESRGSKPFRSFADFLCRTNSNFVRKDVIQALAKAGCFDSLKVFRRVAHDLYADIRVKSKKHLERYGNLDDFNCVSIDENYEWDKKEKIRAELDTLGECISGSFNDLYDGFFTDRGKDFKTIKKLPDGVVVNVEVIVDEVLTSIIQNGKNKGSVYGRVNLLDKNKEAISMIIWADHWKKVKNSFVEGNLIKANCRINIYKDAHSLILERVEAVKAKV
jgi:DNA polymerase-3 subunit alpha